MPADSVACTLVLIHGLGDQPPDTFASFRARFTDALGDDAARVNILEAYWAPLSKLQDLVHPTLAPGGAPVATGIPDNTSVAAAKEFTLALGKDVGVSPEAHALDPVDVLRKIQGAIPGGRELIIDVGNYVGRNGVRTAVQSVLHERLAEAHRDAPGVPIVLASHSQGTIISYDVLRQAGASYPQLRTWITMGCPLVKYLTLFQWGAHRLNVPEDLRWVNIFDPEDIVGRALSGLVDWPRPQPLDEQVDNKRNSTEFHDAHDHWHNPEVVQLLKAEVSALLP
jgi:hypothetical protein